ncbi:prepilin-type N-terminal cleavage/methylation domain-containing protein [Brevundimonas aurifodinae]|uniref:Prepilin-type N-terminal cleavage/methylation domain-containing protein n=2 Tax=Brevundimonas TaxID=41275 RepID=A0ABV1NPN0_9CAUL|nr:MAG: type II secretion system protein GspH [Brevundimonas sp. 12-68-7]OYX30507.1 MAG: type II secretion system protein GspH [Brevundimonas subvibrioides]
MIAVGGQIVGRARREGMTLVEILVVLAIVGVMAGVVTLGVGLSDRGMGVESEANRLADRLRLAADDVLVTRRPLALAFDGEGYGFVRPEGQPTGVVEALAERHALPPDVILVGLETVSPLMIDPDGGQPIAVFGLAKGDRRWRVEFDGLNAVARPVADEAA